MYSFPDFNKDKTILVALPKAIGNTPVTLGFPQKITKVPE